MTPQYQKWLVEGDEEMNKMPLKELGALVHDGRAAARHVTLSTAHAARDQVGKGSGVRPSTFADGTSAVVDENYVRQSVMDPQAHVVQDLNRSCRPIRVCCGIAKFWA